jgi:hypothetical protein
MSESISKTSFQNDVFNPQIIAAITFNDSVRHKTCHKTYGYFYRDRSVTLHFEITQLNRGLMSKCSPFNLSEDSAIYE